MKQKKKNKSSAQETSSTQETSPAQETFPAVKNFRYPWEPKTHEDQKVKW